MIFEGIEFVVNPDLPAGRRLRIVNNRMWEVTPQVYAMLQILDTAHAQFIPFLAKLAEASPEDAPRLKEMMQDLASFVTEVQQVADESKRLPHYGYGVATIGDWTAP